MDKSQKRRREFVVASSDTPEVFETLEKAFDLIAVFVEDFTVFLRISLVFAGRNTGKSLPILNICENFRGIVAPISQHANTFSDDVTQQLYRFRGIIHIAGGDDELHGLAVSVGDSVDFTRQSSSASPNSTISLGRFCPGLPAKFELFFTPVLC